MAVQRVRRIIRKIDPWTVLKVSLVFNAIMALVFVLGTVIFWSIFVNAGIPEKINDLALLVGLENGINLDGAVYFRIVLLLSVIGTILVTGFLTLGAVIYNLISDLVGGIEVIVLEETAAPQMARPRVTLPTNRRPATAPVGRRGIIPALRSAVRPKPSPVEQPAEAEPESEVERTG